MQGQRSEHVITRIKTIKNVLLAGMISYLLQMKDRRTFVLQGLKGRAPGDGGNSKLTQDPRTGPRLW